MFTQALIVAPKRTLVRVSRGLYVGLDRGVLLEEGGGQGVPKPVGRALARARGAGRRAGLQATGCARREGFEELVHLPGLREWRAIPEIEGREQRRCVLVRWRPWRSNAKAGSPR